MGGSPPETPDFSKENYVLDLAVAGLVLLVFAGLTTALKACEKL